jgi:hypothetical protein
LTLEEIIRSTLIGFVTGRVEEIMGWSLEGFGRSKEFLLKETF